MEKGSVVIVNEKDEIIGYKPRNDRSPKDIIRIAGIWIENERGEVLLAQRSLDKKNDPGKWGPAAAGTVEEGESYESNILKETHEEIGILLKPEDITYLGAFYENFSHQYFVGTFYTKINSQTQFILQQEEVEKVRWISWEKLEKELEAKPDNHLLLWNDGMLKRIRGWKKYKNNE